MISLWVAFYCGQSIAGQWWVAPYILTCFVFVCVEASIEVSIGFWIMENWERIRLV